MSFVWTNSDMVTTWIPTINALWLEGTIKPRIWALHPKNLEEVILTLVFDNTDSVSDILWDEFTLSEEGKLNIVQWYVKKIDFIEEDINREKVLERLFGLSNANQISEYVQDITINTRPVIV